MSANKHPNTLHNESGSHFAKKGRFDENSLILQQLGGICLYNSFLYHSSMKHNAEPTNLAANFALHHPQLYLSSPSTHDQFRLCMINGTPNTVTTPPYVPIAHSAITSTGRFATNYTAGEIGSTSEKVQVNLSKPHCIYLNEEPLKAWRDRDPICLAQPSDKYKLSDHQQFLRYQIELFQANYDDVSTHTRGRNKRINIRQVGIRCRHCAHLPASQRQKGSVYFPSTTMGIYQAAQNMSTAHIQCGLCPEMPDYIKEDFKVLIATKSFTTGAGRPYWAKSAKDMGLVDTNNGIRFHDDIPEGVEMLIDKEKNNK